MSESLDLSAKPPLAGGDRFWTIVGEALRGSRRDYTEGPTGRAILLLAITIAFSTIAVVGILVFRRGRWKVKKV